jgi:hypothetical protein
MKVNYVCPCWSGFRRGADALYEKDRSIYMRVQLAQLLRLRHSLSQITICIPFNPEEPAEFRDFLGMWPKSINKTPVVFVETENTLASYGPYNHVYQKYRNEFDYYLLIEDDYVFVQHDFDRILLELINADPECGFLCSRVGICEDGSPIASVSNGIVRTTAFDKINERYGYIPYDGQVAFSDAFRDTGIKMSDFGGNYRCPFYGFGSCAWFHHYNEEDLIVPVQMFLECSRYRQSFLPSSWPDWYNQTLPLEVFTNHEKYNEEFINAPPHGL